MRGNGTPVLLWLLVAMGLLWVGSPVVPLDLIGENIATIPVDKFVAGAKMAVSARKRKKKS